MSDERTRLRLRHLLARIHLGLVASSPGPGCDGGRMRLLEAQALEVEELIDDPWPTRHVEDEPREMT